MPTPAVPAMPMHEYASAECTFSMSRLAIRLPIVARRSPAMTIPSTQPIAMIVVACGGESGTLPTTPPGGSGRPPGSMCGAERLRNSVKDDSPATRYDAGK